MKHSLIYTMLFLFLGAVVVNAQEVNKNNTKEQSEQRKKSESNSLLNRIGNRRVADSKKEVAIDVYKDSVNYYNTLRKNDSTRYTATIKRLRIQNDSLSQELQLLLKFKKEYIRQELSNANKLISVPFGEMVQNSIKTIINKCSEFKGEEEFDALYTKLTHISDIKNKFDQYNQLLNNRINIDVLSLAIAYIDNSHDKWVKICTNEQMNNIIILKEQLQAIVGGLDVFARLITDINTELKLERQNSSANSFVIKSVNSKIDEILVSHKEYIDYYFLKVLYLHERYELYISELKKNPITPNDVVVDIENEMLNVK